MPLVFYILIFLNLSSCAGKTDAPNDKVVALVSDRENVITLSSENNIGQNLSIEEHRDFREIQKINARKRMQSKSLNINSVDPTIKPDGSARFIVIPGGTSPPQDLRRPNHIGSRHERMMEETSSVFSTKANGAHWHTKNFKK